MMKTALLALIVGVFATGCVVTTGGKPATSNRAHHQHPKNKSKSKANNTAPAPAPAPATGGEAVAAPPVATPAPAHDARDGAPASPNLTRTPGTGIAPLTPPTQHRRAPTAEEEEEEKEKKKRTPMLPTRQ